MSGALQAMMSAVGQQPRLPTSITITSSVVAPATATTTVILNTNGDIERNRSGTVDDIGDWISPKTGMALYEVRWTPGGSAYQISIGTPSVWQALSSTRSYGRANVGNITNEQVTGTLEIRRIGTTLTLTSCAVTLNPTCT